MMKRCVISLFVFLVGLLVVLGPSLLATADDGKDDPPQILIPLDTHRLARSPAR
jgi:hypothetical protein